jgi:excisionase family DNA binding protein
MEPGKLLSLDEVADQCGVSRRTVERWIEAGRLKVARFSARLVRVHADEVRRLVDQAQGVSRA